MSFTRWLSKLGLAARLASRLQTRAARPTVRPTIETLEDRWIPSTLTVTNAQDGVAGSLRSEINAAHNGDTIVFAPSLAGQTITLTKGELLLNKNLTIIGPGAGASTISGNNTSRVFEVATGTQVTLTGLTISHGLAKGANGGGILVDTGAVLALNNSTLSANSTISTAKGGGGGSAIYNTGTATLSGTTVSGNSAGGAIYNMIGSTLTVTNNSHVSGNDSTGLFNVVGTATVSVGSTVSDNSAIGIWNQHGTLTVSDSFVYHNHTGPYGGGIRNDGTATISNTILADNSADEYGGGISNSGLLTMTGCTLSGNTVSGDNLVTGYGGGIAVTQGTVSLTDCALSGNSAAYGGGIWYYSVGGNNGGSVTLNDCTRSSNTAQQGGGIFISFRQASGYPLPAVTVTVENNSTIAGNLAPAGSSADDVYNQGVLYVDSSSWPNIGTVDGNPAVPF